MLGRLKFEVDALAEQMLDNIPSEIFESNTTTFLDPAMGGGQFLKAVISRLRKYGHSDANIAGRVFGCEANKMRVNFAADECNNIGTFIIKDFLEEDMSKKFDVIIGNPPYQKANGSDRMGSRGASSLWDKFVFKGLDLLKENGYMSLVHPPAWRKPNERYGLWKELTENNQMIYLKMRSGKREQNIFNIGVRFDYYVIQKTPKHKNTIVVDHEDKTYDLDLSEYSWLPNYAIDEISAMLGKGCKVLYNTAYHTQHDHKGEESADYSNPVVHTINKEGLGIKYFKERKEDIHFGVPKVLLNQNEIQYPVNDYKGEYGMSQLTFGISVESKEQGDKIVEFLKSEKGRRIIAATKWNTFYTDYNMFADFVGDWYAR